MVYFKFHNFTVFTVIFYQINAGEHAFQNHERNLTEPKLWTVNVHHVIYLVIYLALASLMIISGALHTEIRHVGALWQWWLGLVITESRAEEPMPDSNQRQW